MIYDMLWRNKFLTIDAKNLDEIINGLESAVAILKEMRDAGVVIDPDNIASIGDDYAMLITEDEKVAEKFGFILREDDFDEDGADDLLEDI